MLLNQFFDPTSAVLGRADYSTSNATGPDPEANGHHLVPRRVPQRLPEVAAVDALEGAAADHPIGRHGTPNRARSSTTCTFSASPSTPCGRPRRRRASSFSTPSLTIPSKRRLPAG